MKHIKYFEQLNIPAFFIRDTKNPEDDIIRNFSCHTNAWFKDKETAIRYSKEEGSLIEPKQDPKSRYWCGDPELGLSGFKIDNKKDYDSAIYKLIYMYGALDDICVFMSSDYDLDAGADSEDVFRNAKFLFRINAETTYDEYIKRLEQK